MPTYGDISKMKIYPICELWLYYPGASEPRLYTFKNLETGSNMTLEPILVPNDKGGQTVVAWTQKISAIILENNYGTKSQALVDMATEYLSDVEVVFKALTNQKSGAHMHFSPDSSPLPVVKEYSLTMSFDFADLIPRMTLNITGLLSCDLFQSTASIEATFYEVSGF